MRDLKTIPYSMKMKQEFSFFADHVDRRQNQISFLKCQLFKNNDYCQPYTEKLPKTFEDFQYESSLGGFLSDPVKSEKYPGHYKTYVESFRDRDKYTKVNDTELSTDNAQSVQIGFFYLQLKKNQLRKLLHPNKKLCTLKKSKEKTSCQCNYKTFKGNVRGQEFTTYHRLYKHKKLNFHTRNRLQRAFKETESKTENQTP